MKNAAELDTEWIAKHALLLGNWKLAVLNEVRDYQTEIGFIQANSMKTIWRTNEIKVSFIIILPRLSNYNVTRIYYRINKNLF